jgi:hypothetical protein
MELSKRFALDLKQNCRPYTRFAFQGERPRLRCLLNIKQCFTLMNHIGNEFKSSFSYIKDMTLQDLARVSSKFIVI